jgi:hypothetical protein
MVCAVVLSPALMGHGMEIAALVQDSVDPPMIIAVSIKAVSVVLETASKSRRMVHAAETLASLVLTVSTVFAVRKQAGVARRTTIAVSNARAQLALAWLHHQMVLAELKEDIPVWEVALVNVAHLLVGVETQQNIVVPWLGAMQVALKPIL